MILMIFLKKACLLTILCTVFIECQAQPPTSIKGEGQPLEQAEIQADFTYFQQALLSSHPAMYWHVQQDTMSQLFTEAQAKLSTVHTTVDLYKLLAPIVTKIGCGHTFMNLPSATVASLNESTYFLPLNIFYAHEQLYINELFFNDFKIPKGSKLVSINGLAASTITQKLFTYISADNNTATYKRRLLKYVFRDFYHIVFPPSATYTLCFETNHTTRCETIAGVTKARIDSYQAQQAAKSNKPIESKVLSFSIVNKTTAVLKIPSFQDDRIRKGGQAYKLFIDSTFQVLAKRHITNLIIDIRGNVGGSSGNAAILQAYLVDKPFKVDQYMELKTFPLRYVKFPGMTNSEGKEIALKEADFTKMANGHYRKKAYPGLDTIAPQGPFFKHTVYVLIDGLVSSEGSALAALIHHAKRGLFIGEETGGGYNGCTAGLIGQVTLPNSRLNVTLPVFKIVRYEDEQNENRGVRPHHLITLSATDILDGNDLAMAKALQLIGRE